MATYTKPLKQVNIVTKNGDSFIAEDTASGSREGSYAIEMFEKRETIETTNGDVEGTSYVLIPYHSIVSVCENTVEASAYKHDPYGCDGSGIAYATVNDGEVEISVYQNGEKEESGGTTDKTYAEWLELFTNHANYDVILVSACGDFVAEYAEGQFSVNDSDISLYIHNDTDNNIIYIGGEIEEQCLPMQIVVSEK